MLQRSGPVGASHWAAAWVILLQPVAVTAQNPLYPGVRPFIAVDAPVIALEHVRAIDGTGAALREDQTIVIAQGKIRDVGPASQTRLQPGQNAGSLESGLVRYEGSPSGTCTETPLSRK